MFRSPATDPTRAAPLGAVDLPSTPSSRVVAQQFALALVRDLAAGNARLLERAAEYLPRAPGEQPNDYAVRCSRATLFNAFLHSVHGLIGYLFGTPPQLLAATPGGTVPPILREHWENIDASGTHGDVFAREIATDAMIAGHAAILVDFPDTGGVQTMADEAAGTIRPYWVPIRKENIISWRTVNENGATVLVQLVLREVTAEPTGPFGDALVTRYRVFTRENDIVGWRLLELTDTRQVVEIASGIYPTQTEIPISEVATAGRRSLFESDPPLLDLAYLNLAHYRQWSDYDTSIHKTCVPILFTAGVQPVSEQGQPLVVGPNTAIGASDTAAKAKYVSHSGEALAACKASLDDLERQMGQMGLAALAPSKRIAETATAREIDTAAEQAMLATTARGLQDALERAFDFHARYLRLPESCRVSFATNYNERAMDAPTMRAWATLAAGLSLPPRVVIEALIDGGRLPENTDVAALEIEMLAALEVERQQQADTLRITHAEQPAGQTPTLLT